MEEKLEPVKVTGEETVLALGFDEEGAESIIEDIESSRKFGADAHELVFRIAPETQKEIIQQLKAQLEGDL
jgi:hypothetical protein